MSETGETERTCSDLDSEDEEYENALEDVEIDESSELYQTIVAAIMEESDSQVRQGSTEELDSAGDKGIRLG